MHKYFRNAYTKVIINFIHLNDLSRDKPVKFLIELFNKSYIITGVIKNGEQHPGKNF